MSSDPMTNIESVLQEERIFAPSEELSACSRISNMATYEEMVAKAKTDPEGFWGGLARKELHWFEPFHTVLDWNNPPFARWFEGGSTNLAFNCLDRHINAGKGEKLALIWEGEPGDVKRYTYLDLFLEVCKFSKCSLLEEAESSL